jgi:hypothetical protein
MVKSIFVVMFACGCAWAEINILPLLEGGSLNRADQPEFWYFDKNLGRKKKKKGTLTGAIRLGDWKLLTAYGEPKELYNLKDDPLERKNRIGEQPEKTAELAKRLADWLAAPRETFKISR